MSPNRSILSLLTILAAVSTANCGRFSLHFSLPQSSYLQDRTLCVNLIGKAGCSIAEAPLQDIDRDIAFDFEGPNRPTIKVSISLTRNSIAAWHRRQFSVGFTRFLPIENGSINVILQCQKNFFGAACDLHCISDSRKICDIHGQFSCNEGWTGPDCEKKSSSTPASVPSVSSMPSTTSLPATTILNSPARIQKKSNDVNFFYGFYFGILLLLLSILCMIFLLIKTVVRMSNPLESIIKRRSVENKSLSHSPIFYTKNGSNNIDFDMKDTGINNSFNSDEERTYIEIYV